MYRLNERHNLRVEYNVEKLIYSEISCYADSIISEYGRVFKVEQRVGGIVK
ncbi:MAG: hypothetical protein IKK33_09715 [Lachnospiraceae bacterium]|nr:hypothetical protein [Lachnospiraceae bacterium]